MKRQTWWRAEDVPDGVVFQSESGDRRWVRQTYGWYYRIDEDGDKLIGWHDGWPRYAETYGCKYVNDYGPFTEVIG
ncbi:hypothetical protein GS448_24420 [Rhodococcus hoagii]|nr:hypothetical protein [Prescottella equi]